MKTTPKAMESNKTNINTPAAINKSTDIAQAM